MCKIKITENYASMDFEWGHMIYEKTFKDDAYSFSVLKNGRSPDLIYSLEDFDNVIPEGKEHDLVYGLLCCVQSYFEYEDYEPS